MSETSISRRDLFTRSRDIGGLATLAALLTGRAEGTGDGGARDVYTSIGVRPFINARGTYTILSGSTMLPEVRAAMDQAARQYVHLDELTDAIGARLAALTSAEWGLVTSGCAAALTHATAACVAGGNPDLHVRMPDLRGFAKDEVDHPQAFAQRVRRRDSRGRRACGRGLHARRARSGAGPPHRDGVRAGGSRGRQEPTDRGGDGAPHAPARRADPRRCRCRDPHDPEHPLTERRDAGGLQRRQVSARTADGRPVAGPQGSGEGGLGPQRPAPRLCARDEGGQGGSDRDAGCRGAMGAPRPRRGVAAMDGVARRDRATREDCGGHRADHGGHATCRSVEPHALAAHHLGPRGAGHNRRRRRTDVVSNRAAHLAVPRPEQRRGAKRRLHHART